jgi:hypothetical protein
VRAKKINYEVVVGNIGKVYSGSVVSDAIMTFIAYYDQSTQNRGRAAGESVTMFQDGEPIKEHIGSVDQQESL